MVHLKNSSDLSFERRPTSKSDEFFKCTILVIELQWCKILTFPKSGAVIGGATRSAACSPSRTAACSPTCASLIDYPLHMLAPLDLAAPDAENKLVERMKLEEHNARNAATRQRITFQKWTEIAAACQLCTE